MVIWAFSGWLGVIGGMIFSTVPGRVTAAFSSGRSSSLSLVLSLIGVSPRKQEGLNSRETILSKVVCWKQNVNANGFWRAILNQTGPDTPLTLIVDEGDQAMKLPLLHCVLLLLPVNASPQEPQKPAEEKSATESKSPSDTAKQVNPVKPTPSSIASGKKSYTYDCAMCHGKEGGGDGDLATDMHLKLRDYRDPAALKERTDGETYSILAHRKGKMTGGGDR